MGEGRSLAQCSGAFTSRRAALSVWTVMLALGAWRLASLQVLTRQPQSIEALGATTVLCVDKTGTLTCNRLAIAALHDGMQAHACERETAANEVLRPLLRIAALACVREGLEPMDAAILRLAGEIAPAGGLRWREGVLPGRLFVCNDWASGAGGLLAIKAHPRRCCRDALTRLRASVRAPRRPKLGRQLGAG